MEGGDTDALQEKDQFVLKLLGARSLRKEIRRQGLALTHLSPHTAQSKTRDPLLRTPNPSQSSLDPIKAWDVVAPWLTSTRTTRPGGLRSIDCADRFSVRSLESGRDCCNRQSRDAGRGESSRAFLLRGRLAVARRLRRLPPGPSQRRLHRQRRCFCC